MTRIGRVAALATVTAAMTAGCVVPMTADEPVERPSKTRTTSPDEAAGVGDGGSAQEPEHSPAAPSQTPVPRVQDEPAPPVADGSRSNPYPIGTVVSSTEWDVVLGTPINGTSQVLAENMFNDPPPAGMEYWIVPVHAVYTGSQSGLAWVELDFAFVGNDARTYEDTCGVIPGDLFEIGELYTGGVADGNTCVTVPAGAPGLWTVAPRWGDPVFFAVPAPT